MSKELIELESDPYSLFLFALNSPSTKEKCVPRLQKFFDFVNLSGTMQEKCSIYVNRSSVILRSEISASITSLSSSSLMYILNLSQAFISDKIMSFLSLDRLWKDSTNEYITFLPFSLLPQVLAVISCGSSDSAMFILTADS